MFPRMTKSLVSYGSGRQTKSRKTWRKPPSDGAAAQALSALREADHLFSRVPIIGTQLERRLMFPLVILTIVLLSTSTRQPMRSGNGPRKNWSGRRISLLDTFPPVLALFQFSCSYM